MLASGIEELKPDRVNSREANNQYLPHIIAFHKNQANAN